MVEGRPPGRRAPAVTGAPTGAAARLGHLRSLGPGWHDGDGLAVARGAVDAALSFAEARPMLAGRSRFFPTLAGGVQLEFGSDAVDLEIEFGVDGRVRLLWSREAGETCGEEAFDSVSDRLLASVDSCVASLLADGAT